MITIFPNLFKKDNPSLISVDHAIERIRHGTDFTRPIIEALRNTSDAGDIKRLKEQLPVYLWSGEFAHRNSEGCRKHSGLICLDFDDEIKERVIKNQYVYIAFNSPTGTGVKAIVRIPPLIEQHERNFKGLQQYFNLPTLDKGGDLPRSCFDSIDPDIYINPEAPEFIAEEAEEKPQSTQVYFPVKDSDEIIRRILIWLDRRERFGEGNRNHYIHSMAAAMNRFGVEREQAEFFTMQYAQEGFSAKEIATIVKSAYSKTSDFATAQFENVRQINNLKIQKQAGASDESLIEQVKLSGVRPVEATKLIRSLEKGKEITSFWTIEHKPNDKVIINFDFMLLYGWLHQRGFYRYRIAPGSVILIRKVNNIIHIIEKAHIIDAINQYLLELTRSDPGNKKIYQAFVKQSRSILHNDQLLFLDYIEPEWISDTPDAGYFFFQNQAVKVTRKRIEIIEYQELPGCIWANQIIDRDLHITDDIDCEFSQFLTYVSTGSEEVTTETQGNFLSICAMTGYLLHNYKDRSKPQAMILTDEAISDNAEGGTGKGIFVRAIGHMKELVFIDGKNWSFDKAFLWQRVNIDSQVIWIDDVKREFNFERLFSVLTEGIEVEKKNQNPFFIEFHKSPKFVITTNYTVKGEGNSSLRRRFEFEFKQYFNKDRTPADVFGHNLFDGWDDDEWRRFDNFMFYCLKYYLQNGLTKPENRNLSFKKLLTNTNQDWIDWAQDNLDRGGQWVKSELHNSFVSDCPDYNKIKVNTVTKWAEIYCAYKGYKLEHLISDRKRCVRIVR